MPGIIIGIIAFIFGTFFAIVNVFGGVIAGIWLSILGEWELVLIGLGCSILMPFVFLIISISAKSLSRLVSWAQEGNLNMIARGFILISVIYNNYLIYFWAYTIYFFFTRYITHNNPCPFLVWSYSIVMAPFSYMAIKAESRPVGHPVMLFLALVFSTLFSLQYFLIIGSLSHFTIIVFIIAISLLQTAAAPMKANSIDKKPHRLRL